jgi:hypothetical protein
MRITRLPDMKVTLAIGVACLALSGPFGMLAPAARAQSAAVDLPAGVDDIVKLTKAGMSEDIVLAKVKKVGVTYDLTTDQMIYLKNQGVSQNVITALLQAGSASAPAAPASTPSSSASSSASLPPPPAASAPAPDSGGGQASASVAPDSSAEPVVNFDYFQGQLSPYGSWVDVPGYGQCWQPSVESGWRPYYDAGHWVYSDAGLYWQSDNPWGSVVFHYGSWTYAGAYGWVWVPGYEYAPSRVFWRNTDGYLGWAPLPPGAVFVDGGWLYGGRRFGAAYDFGYGASFYVFVGSDHFWEHDYHRFILRGEEFHRIYGRSEVNRFRRDEHGRFGPEGLDREHLERITGHKVEEVRHEELRAHDRAALREDHQRIAVEHERTRAAEAHVAEARDNEKRGGESHPGESHPGEKGAAGSHPGEKGAGERPDASEHGKTGPQNGKSEGNEKAAPQGKPAGNEKGEKKDQKQSNADSNERVTESKHTARS